MFRTPGKGPWTILAFHVSQHNFSDDSSNVLDNKGSLPYAAGRRCRGMRRGHTIWWGLESLRLRRVFEDPPASLDLIGVGGARGCPL